MEEFFKNRSILKNVLILLLFVVVSLVIYYPTLHAQPLWDDWVFIFKSWTIKNIAPWEFWVLGNHRRSWPMFFTVLVGMYKAFGMNVFYYHLTSVLLHSCNGYLIYKVLKKLGGQNNLLLALLYVVHPLNFFTVSWIIQIKTLLCIFFFIISIYFFVKSCEGNSKASYWISVLSFGLSVLSKSAFAPIVLVFLILKNKKRFIPYLVMCTYAILLTTWTTHIKKIIPFATVNTFLISDAHAQQKMSLAQPQKEFSRPEGSLVKRPLEPTRDIVLTINNFSRYTLFLIYPNENLIVHPTTLVSYSYKELLIAIFILSFFIYIIGWLLRRKDNYSLGGIYFFTLSLLPLCGLFFVPIFHYSTFVEYWLSVPAIGLIFFLSRLKIQQKMVWVLRLFLILFAARTLISSTGMATPVDVIKKSISHSPDNTLIELILAKHYYFEEEFIKSNEILLRVLKSKKMQNEVIEKDIDENLKRMKGEKNEIFTL